jgi:hypothetical protein
MSFLGKPGASPLLPITSPVTLPRPGRQARMGSSDWKIAVGLVLVAAVEWSLARGSWPLAVCFASMLLILAWLVIDPGVVQPDEDHPD